MNVNDLIHLCAKTFLFSLFHKTTKLDVLLDKPKTTRRRTDSSIYTPVSTIDHTFKYPSV